MNGVDNQLFCSTFGELFDSGDFGLTLQVIPRNEIDWGADASTNMDGNNMTISFAEDLCDGDDHPLEIAGTLLHESIHAKMYHDALRINPDVSESDYCLIWQEHFETNDPCH